MPKNAEKLYFEPHVLTKEPRWAFRPKTTVWASVGSRTTIAYLKHVGIPPPHLLMCSLYYYLFVLVADTSKTITELWRPRCYSTCFLFTTWWKIFSTKFFIVFYIFQRLIIAIQPSPVIWTKTLLSSFSSLFCNPNPMRHVLVLSLCFLLLTSVVTLLVPSFLQAIIKLVPIVREAAKKQKKSAIKIDNSPPV